MLINLESTKRSPADKYTRVDFSGTTDEDSMFGPGSGDVEQSYVETEIQV